MDAHTAPSELFQRIEASFLRQGLMQHLGARLLRVEPGRGVENRDPVTHELTVRNDGDLHGLEALSVDGTLLQG